VDEAEKPAGLWTHQSAPEAGRVVLQNGSHDAGQHLVVLDPGILLVRVRWMNPGLMRGPATSRPNWRTLKLVAW
jgi:hypothetical protein